MTPLVPILAVTLIVHPLTNPEVLEPSILNEVERALDQAVTNQVSCSVEMTDFATLYATNGLNATQQAIALVSSQKAGRWFWRGVDVTPVAVKMLRQLAGWPEPQERPAVTTNCTERIVR